MVRSYFRLEEIERKAEECGITISHNPLQNTHVIAVYGTQQRGWHIKTRDLSDLFVVFTPEQPRRPNQKIKEFKDYLRPSFLR